MPTTTKPRPKAKVKPKAETKSTVGRRPVVIDAKGLIRPADGKPWAATLERPFADADGFMLDRIVKDCRAVRRAIFRLALSLHTAMPHTYVAPDRLVNADSLLWPRDIAAFRFALAYYDTLEGKEDQDRFTDYQTEYVEGHVEHERLARDAEREREIPSRKRKA